MKIIEVTTEAYSKLFIEMAPALYTQNANYIRPLNKDVADVFDPKKNKAFRNGTAKRWLLQSNDGKMIGRIAAFINKKYKSKGDDVPVGGIGFFECINNQPAANMLFDTAKNWLSENGMEAMDGPINFGERDRWWGLVTYGFQEPLYCMNYNPPYYVSLFETYGFKTFFEQICFFLDPKVPINQKFIDRSKAFEANPQFTFTTIKKNNLAKYAADFCEVYNKAWAGHGGLKQMNKEQAHLLFKKMAPVMDENIIYFVYHQNQPIAFFLNLPDLNQWFKHLNGKWGLLQKLYFLWLKQFSPNKKFTGLVFGVAPEWQGKGVDAFMITQSHYIIASNKVPYTEYEMQWIGDFNPKMINIAQGLGDVTVSRKLSTMRYLFDQNKIFQRHPILQ